MPDFTYIYDTYCGWCRGSHPIITALIKSGANVNVLHRHLFQNDRVKSMKDGFGEYAFVHDTRISALSNQEFSQKYVDNVLKSPTEAIDSTLTAWAAALVHDQGAELEMEVADSLIALRYQEGRSAYNRDGISEVLSKYGIHKPLEDGKVVAEQISRDAIRILIEQGRTSVPTLLRHTRAKTEVIDLIDYFGTPEDITAIAA